VLATAILVALPVIVGVILFELLLANTVTLLALTVGGNGLTVIEIVAGAEVPPGPVAVMATLSLPT
jgi:hypothetical protein